MLTEMQEELHLRRVSCMVFRCAIQEARADVVRSFAETLKLASGWETMQAIA